MTTPSFRVHHPPSASILYPSTASYPRWPQRLSEQQRTSGTPVTWLPFSYDGLPCDRNQVRRLILHPGVLGEPIFMDMNTSGDSNRAHHNHLCLYYTWGSPGSEHEVIINGRSFRVRDNLYQFLRMASRHKIFMRRAGLWIDAMCIDQGNDIEKAHQVRKMGDIYRHAKQTIIWFGDGAEIDAAIQKVKVCSWKKTEVSDVEALKFLCSHVYWDRTWVTQEVLMSSKLRIMSAHRDVTWEQFGLAIEICLRRGLIQECFATLFWQKWKATHQKPESKFEPCFDPCINHSIWDLLRWRIASGCTDTRDRIYAMINLTGDGYYPGQWPMEHDMRAHINYEVICRDGVPERFPVDYTESVVNLFWRAGDHYGAWTRKDLTEMLMRTLNLTALDLERSIDMVPEREIKIPIKRIKRAQRWTHLTSRRIVCSYKHCHGQQIDTPLSSNSRWEYIACTQLHLPNYGDKHSMHLLVRPGASEHGSVNGLLETALIIPESSGENASFYSGQYLQIGTPFHRKGIWVNLTSWSEAKKEFEAGLRPLRLMFKASVVIKMLQSR